MTIPPTVMPVGMEPPIATAVVDLVNGVHAALGDDTIEWGVASGAVALLQARRAARTDRPVPAPRRRRRYPPVAARIARAAARCPGPLGEAWVLPWGFTLDRLPRSDPLVVSDVCRRDRGGTSDCRGTRGEHVADRRRSVRSRLGCKLAARARFRAVPRARSALHVPAGGSGPGGAPTGASSTVSGRTLRGDGVLDHAEQVWRLDTDGARASRERWRGRAADGPRAMGAVRVLRRSRSWAHERPARSASPGIGAGRAFIVDGLDAEVRHRPAAWWWCRALVPQLASLCGRPQVWSRERVTRERICSRSHVHSGYRRSSGSIADTLGGKVVAVDGDEGTVSVLDPWQVDERPLASVAVPRGADRRGCRPVTDHVFADLDAETEILRNAGHELRFEGNMRSPEDVIAAAAERRRHPELLRADAQPTSSGRSLGVA